MLVLHFIFLQVLLRERQYVIHLDADGHFLLTPALSIATHYKGRQITLLISCELTPATSPSPSIHFGCDGVNNPFFLCLLLLLLLIVL
jgi:N-acetylglucosamine-6-phosphate deacetylase